MKIAAVTEDGTTISQHFGRAPYYLVVTVEDGKIVNKEKRDKEGHHSFAGIPDEHIPGQGHGYGTGSQEKHARMAQAITDCQVLLAGGMGWGAYDSLKNAGIEVITTDVENIEEAVKLYLQGELPNLMERLH